MGVVINILPYYSPSSKLQIGKAGGDKVLLSDNYQVNLTTIVIV